MRKIKIQDKFVGEDEPCFIIAEAGGNANSDIKLARELIKKAADAGVDAIKFQNFRAEKLVTKTAPKYWVDTLGEWTANKKPRGYQIDEFKLLDQLPENTYPELIKLAEKLGIVFFSTPFDEDSVDFLDELGVPLFKIASADITYLSFIKRIAEKGKPVILSTGASNLDEIKKAVNAIESTGNKDIILLHCTLHYPTAIENANLRMIQTIQNKFPDYPVGLSDHTMGNFAPTIAVALGAKAIEKHYTLDKSLPYSSDHFMSVDPPELEKLVNDIRLVEVAMGSAEKKIVPVEIDALKFARRSVVANQDIPKGTKITGKMLICKRPGTGIQPNDIEKIIGKKTKREIKKDSLIGWKDIE